ncbi:MAG: hypothetical protein ACREI9_10750 [Nitrospiraceae bacterium]
MGGGPVLVAARAGVAHAHIEDFELGVPDLVSAPCDPHGRQRVTGSQQEDACVLVKQVLPSWGSGAADHHHRAGSRLRVDLPAGLGVRAVPGEMTGGLCRSAGTPDGNGKVAVGCVPGDDERRTFDITFPIYTTSGVGHGHEVTLANRGAHRALMEVP